MAEFARVLNSVIRLSEIKKIDIVYRNGTNYSNRTVHTLFITYLDGTKEKFETTEMEQATADYEGLKNALLNYGAKMDKEREG